MAGAAPVTAADWPVRWQPLTLVNGAPVLFRVTPPVPLNTLCGEWLGRQVFFSQSGVSRTWYGIAGVSLDTRPGRYVLNLEGITAGGKPVSFQKLLVVHSAHYRRIAVKVARQFTEPSAEQLHEIGQDKNVKHDIFARIDPERAWAGLFRPPVKAQVSGVFGTRRTFNGQVQSTHQGLDYAVPVGTPVAALNRGTVLLARPLYFEGNCVVLDHGQGLLTIYMHLSTIEVKEGESVHRGEEIGLSGGTGRSTGPHLHVAVRWQGFYLNPATMMKLKLP